VEVPQAEQKIQAEESGITVAAEEKAETKAGERHSFTEWLHHLQQEPAEKEEREEREGQPEEEELIIDAGALHEARYQMEAAGLEEEHETETAISGDEALSEADLDRTKEMAARSLTMDESLITETLAKVYEIQGKQEKAIEIYQKLILKIPERSTYFSARIKKLKGS
jgi:tetratricopeptide (TPR) repeat protein